ncbi:MAG TPA: geranylgeranyl reductase family protein [Rhodocyclaceae bacterium]|nr:geranylgeranyl reductase family protein [Rhodocyclaceae bacterium]
MRRTENEFDVIVVGAGPGGATTAYYLMHEARQHGLELRVALLDKARFPRDKYCGDAWCAPALDILEEMGVLQKIVADGLYQDTKSGGFVSPNGENYMTSEGGDAAVSTENRTFAIKRMICDERIARRAAEAGAELIEEANVTSAELGDDGKGGNVWRVRCTDEREFRCRMLIAADGATSKLARMLGIVKSGPEAVAARRYVKGGTHNFKAGGVLLFPEYILPGYVALFRHYNDDIDLGAYIIPGGAAKVEEAARIYEDKILNDPFIQRVLGPRVEYLEPVRTASLRMGGVECSTMQQFMVVGDAAGQTDPLTGEGIHTAMIGGRLAARRVLEMFAEKNFSDDACAIYHQRWMAAFGKDFKSSAMSARMSYRFPYFLDGAATLAQRAGDAFMNEFGAIMTGVKPKSTYARPDIALPLAWEVSKQFFKQKVLRQPAGYAAYRMRAAENSSRKSAFNSVCLRDQAITPQQVQDAWAQQVRVNPAEELFQFASSAPDALPLLILYGSEYGFCRSAALRLAEELAETKLDGASFSPRVLDLAAHELIDWSREPLAMILCATAGDGEVPENAKKFFQWLEALDKPDASLENLSYMVLACGDSAYPNFCQAGQTLDSLLEKAGARALLPCHEVDQQDETQLGEWFDALQEQLANARTNHIKLTQQGGGEDYLYTAAQIFYAVYESNAQISRAHPCRARIVGRTMMTHNELQKTVSLELDLRHFPDPRRMEWLPGDALGVLAHNAPELVARVLALMNQDPDTLVEIGKDSLTLEEALLSRYDIKSLSRQRVERFVARIGDEAELARWQEFLAQHGNDVAATAREYAQGRELIDLLEDFPETAAQFEARDWLPLLSAIQPRFYSIASSPLVDAEKISLIVSVVRYETHGKAREGLASCYLGTHLEVGGELDVFLQRNNNFRPPSIGTIDPNADAPIGCVMIGPGTGVAPFRSFIQHLAKQAEAAGKTLASVWHDGNQPLLFFGCRHPEQDFLYAEEWKMYEAQGAIRLFTAFSRAQAEKIYVQHRLLEQQVLIWERLERGAQFYICGDATHMAGDVERALLEIIATQGAMSAEQSRTYLDAVAVAGRYHKDVWA